MNNTFLTVSTFSLLSTIVINFASASSKKEDYDRLCWQIKTHTKISKRVDVNNLFREKNGLFEPLSVEAKENYFPISEEAFCNPETYEVKRVTLSRGEFADGFIGNVEYYSVAEGNKIEAKLYFLFEDQTEAFSGASRTLEYSGDGVNTFQEKDFFPAEPVVFPQTIPFSEITDEEDFEAKCGDFGSLEQFAKDAAKKGATGFTGATPLKPAFSTSVYKLLPNNLYGYKTTKSELAVKYTTDLKLENGFLEVVCTSPSKSDFITKDFLN